MKRIVKYFSAFKGEDLESEINKYAEKRKKVPISASYEADGDSKSALVVFEEEEDMA